MDEGRTVYASGAVAISMDMYVAEVSRIEIARSTGSLRFGFGDGGVPCAASGRGSTSGLVVQAAASASEAKRAHTRDRP
jgi:hypothetical protein